MTPKNCGKGAVSFSLSRGSILSAFISAAALFFGAGCNRESDSVPIEAQVQVLERQPQPVRRNYGYPRPMHSSSREAARLPENVESKLPIYAIKMDPEHLQAMDMNPYDAELYPVQFTADGVIFEGVKIRYRGAWGRTWPKKPLKIFFPEEKPFHGQRRLNLNSAWRDPSFIRETLAYRIYEACGAPASKSRLARVHLNNELRGLYVEVEQSDKAFLKERKLKGATIFKASSRMKMADERPLHSLDEYRMHYEQETQKDEGDGYGELHRFFLDMSRASDVADFFEKRVDLERYINYVAATTLCQNWDGYNKNHFLVYNANDSGKWFILPWDLDRSLGDHWDWSFGNAELPIDLGTARQPGITGWNRMMDRFFSDPKLRARFAERLQELLEKEFTPEKLHPMIDQMAAEMEPEARLDRQLWPVQDPDVAGALRVVKQFINDRRAFLLRELPRFREQAPSTSRPRQAVRG